MLGLLAFTLSLTINIAQNRFEFRRGLVVQEANAIEAAWLRSKLITGEEGAVIATLDRGIRQGAVGLCQFRHL